MRKSLTVVALVVSSAGAAAGQTVEGGPDPSRVRVRIGPLWLDPRIALTNLGVDTNVFNDPPERGPKEDFTVTITPQTELWLRAGRTWINGTIKEDVVWYQKYATERSTNASYVLAWRVPLNRLLVNTSATWRRSRERTGFEIDRRAQHSSPTYLVTAEVRALSKTLFGVRGSWSEVHYDKEADFLGINLHDQLNRTTTSGAVTVRHEVTPLTSLTFAVSRSNERFEFSPLRDSTSTEVSGSVSFDPLALVKGTATVGYTDFDPSSPDLSSYKGTTAKVDVSYTLLGATRFGVQVTRNIEASYDVNQPFYLFTGLSASIAQQVFGPFDAVVRAGTGRLAYRDRAGAVIAAADRIDHTQSYGLGLGYHVGQDLRLGFNVDRERRTSHLSSRRYEGWRYGTAVSYGL